MNKWTAEMLISIQQPGYLPCELAKMASTSDVNVSRALVRLSRKNPECFPPNPTRRKHTYTPELAAQILNEIHESPGKPKKRIENGMD